MVGRLSEVDMLISTPDKVAGMSNTSNACASHAERQQVFPLSQTSVTITAEYEAFITQFYCTNLQIMVFTTVVL